MNAMITFAPILALVAFLSVEVSAEIASHTALEKFTDGFVSMSYEYTGGPTITILPTPAGGCDGTLTGCELPVAGADQDTKVMISAVVPPAADLAVPADVGTPTSIIIKQCFSPAATVGRKWRKMNDPFKKDNSCKTGSSAIGAVDYPVAGGEIGPAELTLGGATPTSLMTFRAYVKCSEQGDDQFCHMVNYKTDAGDPVYYPTEVLDNRPAGLFTAVLICAFIGPLMLAAFLFYERGYLANKSA